MVFKSVWWQVYSYLQDSSKYSCWSKLYYGLNSLDPSFHLQFLHSLSRNLETIPREATTADITVTLALHRFFLALWQNPVICYVNMKYISAADFWEVFLFFWGSPFFGFLSSPFFILFYFHFVINSTLESLVFRWFIRNLFSFLYLDISSEVLFKFVLICWLWLFLLLDKDFLVCYNVVT